jgi:hypothetical protein
VLLRRLIHRSSSSNAWDALQPSTKEGLKSGSIAALGAASATQSTRRAVCSLIAEVATRAAGEGARDWPALLPSILPLAQSADPVARTTSLFLCKELAEYCEGSVLEPHSATMQALFSSLLADANLDVAVAALEAAVALISRLVEDSNKALFQAQVPGMLRVLELALSAPDGSGEEHARRVLKELVSLVTYEPHFVRPYLEAACTGMLAIVNRDTFDDECVVCCV